MPPSCVAAAFIVGFGCIFAPLWGAMFGWLYGLFSSDDAEKTNAA